MTISDRHIDHGFFIRGLPAIQKLPQRRILPDGYRTTTRPRVWAGTLIVTKLLLNPSKDGFHDVPVFGYKMARGVVAMDIDVLDPLQQIMLVAIQKYGVLRAPQ